MFRRASNHLRPLAFATALVAGGCNAPAPTEPVGRASTGPSTPFVSAPSANNGAERLATLDDVVVAESPGDDDSPGLRLVYNPRAKDAVAWWGECVAEIQKCDDEADGPRRLTCIESIATCIDDKESTACCPPSCFQSFRKRIANGTRPQRASDESFVDGHCVPGFTDLVNQAGNEHE